MITRFFDNVASDDETEYAEQMMKEVAATTYVGMHILILFDQGISAEFRTYYSRCRHG